MPQMLLVFGSGVSRLVDTASYPPESRVNAPRVRSECRLHGCPEQRLARKLFSRRMDLAPPHRLLGALEHQRDRLEYRTRLDRGGACVPRAHRSAAQQPLVKL
jgi:hypothetical protein